MATERERNRCVVKESPTGQPFLWFDPLDGQEMPSFIGIYFGLDLKPGTTHEEAQRLAEHINEHSIGMFALQA
jgi:hypothetical protein